MKNKYIKLALKLFSIISLLSVGIFAQSNLDSMRWNLTEINRQKVKNSKAFIEIDQNRLTGNAGCNQIFGKFSIKGKKINFGEITTTKMFCSEDGVMKLESDLTNALEKVTRFEKSGWTLNLYANKKLILKFEAFWQSDSSIKLEDKKWVLAKFLFTSIKPAPFINFDKVKASVGGNTGCNVFGGNYTTKGEKIKFFGIISTMRACVEDEQMNIEREFKNALEKADRFEIVAGTLILYKGKDLLLEFRAEPK